MVPSIRALVLVACVLGAASVPQVTTAANPLDPPQLEHKAIMKPEVAALLRQSGSLYAAMKSYKHTAKWSIAVKVPEGEVQEDLNFTLALARPNQFIYKLDSTSKFFAPVAAYCDGATFVNFKARLGPVPTRQYIKTGAPDSFKGINIVDDVEFQPIGTYIIALMLQGDVLADKDVRAAMEKATLKPAVTEGGKKWLPLEILFGEEETPITLYFGAEDHLIGKAVQKGATRITEIEDAVKIDKPIEPSTFQYTLPPDAKQVEHFTAPQRPDDARRGVSPVRVALR